MKGEGFFRAGELLFKEQNYDLAEEILKDLVRATPNFPGAHRGLAYVYRDKNLPDQAMQQMEIEVQ